MFILKKKAVKWKIFTSELLTINHIKRNIIKHVKFWWMNLLSSFLVDLFLCHYASTHHLSMSFWVVLFSSLVLLPAPSWFMAICLHPYGIHVYPTLSFLLLLSYISFLILSYNISLQQNLICIESNLLFSNSVISPTSVCKL